MIGIFMENKSVWDKIKLDQLETLWSEGMPITKIGIELGVSRNAIAGKAHRLGLPKRNSPISKSGEPRKNQIKLRQFVLEIYIWEGLVKPRLQ